MKAFRNQSIDQRLGALKVECPEVEAVALVSVEGLLIASALPDSMEEDLMAAMSAAMLAIGDRIALDLERGHLSQVFVKGESGYVVLMTIDDQAMLTTVATDEAKLGLVLLDMQRTVADLRQLL